MHQWQYKQLCMMQQWKPVQEKLEKQVGDLQDQIAEREARIRKLAIAKVEAESKPNQPVATAEKSQPIVNHPEKIGKVAFQAEKPEAKPEKPEIKVVPVEAKAAPEKKKPFTAETASKQSILRLAENITVERTNLRKLYENHHHHSRYA